MNVFVIPSWYPTPDAPHTGIFIKEQSQALASNGIITAVGISTWGTHRNTLLLEKKRIHLWAMRIYAGLKMKPNEITYSAKCKEYFTPAFTWTRTFLKGNISGIIRANEANLQLFARDFGKPDIIHAHTAYPGGYVALELSKKYSIPYVITEQMSPFPLKAFDFRGVLDPVIKLPYQYSGANIAVSSALMKKMHEKGVPNLHLVSNLTNEDFFQSSESKDSFDGFQFAFIGRMEEQKGVEYLLEAAARLKSGGVSFRLLMGGDGSASKAYKNRALELGLQSHVEWLGQLSRLQVKQCLEKCDCFVLPSIHENHPLVLLEALAMGKPAIATICGGSEEIIEPETGYVVEAGNADQLFLAMSRMIDEHHLFKSDQIRMSFLNRFSSTIIIPQLTALYGKVISNYKHFNAKKNIFADPSSPPSWS